MGVRPNHDRAVTPSEHRLRRCVIGLTLSLLTACGEAPSEQPLSTTPAAEVVIHCGGLIDGIADKLLANQLILVDQGRISSVVSADLTRPEADLSHRDLSIGHAHRSQRVHLPTWTHQHPCAFRREPRGFCRLQHLRQTHSS